MPNMPIDWTSVDWVNVGLLSAIAFIAALIGNILIFRHWFWAAIVAGVLFAAGYVFLAYYPHERPVPGLSTAPPNFGRAITAQKVLEAAPEAVIEDADEWSHSPLQPTTICSEIKCLGFSAARAASSDR